MLYVDESFFFFKCGWEVFRNAILEIWMDIKIKLAKTISCHIKSLDKTTRVLFSLLGTDLWQQTFSSTSWVPCQGCHGGLNMSTKHMKTDSKSIVNPLIRIHSIQYFSGRLHVKWFQRKKKKNHALVSYPYVKIVSQACDSDILYHSSSFLF